MGFYFPVNLWILMVITGFLFSVSVKTMCINSFHDCNDVRARGLKTSGVYHVTPVGRDTGYDVYCDMDTDNGAWLVFQRRFDGSENFYRGWDDYVKGFGNVSGEHWLGNQPLKTILSQGFYELRVDLEDWEGNRRYAIYTIFDIGDYAHSYNLSVGVYSGDAGDSLSHHHGALFSSYDRVNDVLNCSAIFSGSWWFQRCHNAHLNGQYHMAIASTNVTLGHGLQWVHFRGAYYSLKAAEMKIRRG